MGPYFLYGLVCMECGDFWITPLSAWSVNLTRERSNRGVCALYGNNPIQIRIDHMVDQFLRSFIGTANGNSNNEIAIACIIVREFEIIIVKAHTDTELTHVGP